MNKLEQFKKDSLDWANKKEKPDPNKGNVLDDDHTMLWQLTGFCDEQVFGFNNIMAVIMLDKKAKKFSMNYRFAYSDGRKSWYDFKNKTDGSKWHKFSQKMIDEGKDALRKVFQLTAEAAKSEIKMRELEFTGKESLDEVMNAIQNSGLVNIAKVDVKKQTVEVNDDYDELNL